MASGAIAVETPLGTATFTCCTAGQRHPYLIYNGYPVEQNCCCEPAATQMASGAIPVETPLGTATFTCCTPVRPGAGPA
jgi:hypothetical protein